MSRKFLVGVLLCLVGAGPVPGRLGDVQPMPLARPGEAPNLWNQLYGGPVTAVTKASITIVYLGGEETTLRFSPQGKLVDKAITRIPRQPPKTFRVSEALAAGKFDSGGGSAFSYRLSDVRVGDRVCIWYNRVDGVDICERISIDRRPGGRIPPAPGQRSEDPIQWHEWMNAQQDFEEKGIPIPDKYLPHCPGIDEQRIAPMPRLVTPKAPLPKP